MAVFIELLDSKKRPFYDRNGVIKCDGRKAPLTSLQIVAKQQKQLAKRRAFYMQLLIGTSPATAKTASRPYEI